MPQDDSYPETIEHAIHGLLTHGRDAGRAVLDEIAYPVREIARRPAVPKAQAARIYTRDHFLCRYCGRRTILTAVMEVVATIYPDVFPFHRNWKGGLTHPAVLSRSAVVDHVVLQNLASCRPHDPYPSRVATPLPTAEAFP